MVQVPVWLLCEEYNSMTTLFSHLRPALQDPPNPSTIGIGISSGDDVLIWFQTHSNHFWDVYFFGCTSIKIITSLSGRIPPADWTWTPRALWPSSPNLKVAFGGNMGKCSSNCFETRLFWKKEWQHKSMPFRALWRQNSWNPTCSNLKNHRFQSRNLLFSTGGEPPFSDSSYSIFGDTKHSGNSKTFPVGRPGTFAAQPWRALRFHRLPSVGIQGGRLGVAYRVLQGSGDVFLDVWQITLPKTNPLKNGGWGTT